MSENTTLDALPTNLLLANLPSAEYQRLLPKLEQFTLNYGETIYNQGEIIEYVYFPTSGIISLLVAVEANSTLEVGIVGKEGIIGLSLFLGKMTSNNLAIVQGVGSALRMKAADFITECDINRVFSQQLKQFTHSLLIQVSQSAACYRFHPVEARLARWLLMTSDRMETNNFQITQEFLSKMLGVRREAVNKSATILQEQNLISYSRGNILIINRAGLEAESCQCYEIIRTEEKSFPNGTPTAHLK